ncbi:MAG: Imidazole glycerol phosphate synthase subunit HisF [Alphaproteobacteria bacterium MarineAlpha9_Bin4]|nr:imidazole glycerol phosphate synthase subunit HisF [Pelagibacterales bacterium]PPR25379.1 MAG: Imidazole glycerol phosphate synthase subunit HisF [Alphaproteobacteria bacterium MarineAlpha9_Bin4]
MLKLRIIPCLDVKNGRVVKGINFIDLIDAGDPVEQAKIYDRQGADELCFLDITASVENRELLLDIVNKTAKNCFMPLTVGGGVKSVKDIRSLLFAGADKVSINSAAIKNPKLITKGANNFGNQCIVVAIDAKISKNSSIKSGYEVFSHGGRVPTNIDAVDWAKRAVSLGAGELLITSMDRDGTKKGFDINLTKKISSSVSVPIIASGGVGCIKDFIDGFQEGGASGLLAASVFHFGKFKIHDVKKELKNKGLPVRI